MEKIGFPRIGPYTEIIAKTLQELGMDVILPSINNERAFKIANANSPEMQCLPFKYTLADFIDILEKNNNHPIQLLQFKTCGRCRFHCYYFTQTTILKNLGYKFNGIYPVRAGVNTLFDVMNITGANIGEVLFAFRRAYKRFKELEKDLYPKKGSIKIGVIGEIWTINDSRANLGLIKKLQNLDCYVENSLTLSHFITDWLKLKFNSKRKRQRKRAIKIFPEILGGHAINSVENFISFAERGFDSIILVRPLSCMPEVFIETIINSLAEKYKIPLFIQNCDEVSSEVNLENRLEALIESIRIKKEK